MKFLVYSQIRKSEVGNNLGRPEYSYFFVLDPFLPVLAKLGEVIIVADPLAEVDQHFDRYAQAGEPCVFICFAPPNKSILGLRCPTVTVFAWEFDRLPDEVWDDDLRNDWRYTLRQQGRAISLSSDSARVTRNAMGDKFDVAAIPVPVYDRFARSAALGARSPAISLRHFSFTGAAFDSRYYEVTTDAFINNTPADKFGLSLWNGDAMELVFCLGHNGGGLLGGFYETETWGTWSKLAQPWLVMPQLLHGKFTLRFDAVAYGPNFGKTIDVIIGNDVQPLLLDNDTPNREITFNVDEPQALVKLAGLDVSAVPGVTDPRTMGIGLRALHVAPVDVASVVDGRMAKAPALTLDLRGVVYTSVLNPGDDRKNWVDMLTAFCWAFRDNSEATLVLKMTHHSVASFLGVFHYHLQRIGPVKCRVVLLHGFLDHEQYLRLIEVSTFYVNASRCEGLCLPLMEFMSNGVPALAPCNTAMEDYVSEDCVFVVRSSHEPGVWPHDPRNVLRALRYRIDWSSLADQFTRSHAVATADPDRYRQMSSAAAAVQRDFCSEAVVADKLKRFFQC
jgi:hypothetical protein